VFIRGSKSYLVLYAIQMRSAVRQHGKRRIIERVEGNEQEIKKIMQETQKTAQMLLF